MGSGYKKVIIGILLATFHINLGRIQIVPTVIGWVVLTIGVVELMEAFPSIPFRKAGYLAKTLIAYTLITDVAEFFNPTLLSRSSMFRFAPVIYAIIYLLFAYNVLDGSILYVRSLQMEELEKSLVARTGTFIILYLVNSLVICYALAFNGSLFLILAAITGIILNIWFMMMMNELKKLDWHPSPTDSSQNLTDAMDSGENGEQ